MTISTDKCIIGYANFQWFSTGMQLLGQTLYKTGAGKGEQVMIKRLCYRIYHSLQKNYLSLTLISLLQKLQITTMIGDIVCYPSIMREIKHPSEETLKVRAFYEDNSESVREILSLLEDRKSKEVYKNVIAFRMGKAFIKRDCYSMWDQYFCEDIIHLQDGEVFVDGGAYTGDTIENLLKRAKKQGVKIAHVIAFEPGDYNCRILVRKWGEKGNVTIIKKGLSDKAGRRTFLNRGSSSGIVSRNHSAGNLIPVIDIDAVEDCKNATFIKMDIEGAEMSALCGARETILRNHPKLAICIYHSEEDMIQIAKYIHNLVPQYKLYVRHHTRRNHETVLYAVV